jgi:hypothetical protein
VGSGAYGLRRDRPRQDAPGPTIAPKGEARARSFVEGIEARLSGDYGLRMRNGREYTVTRTYKKNLKDLSQLWIGTDGLPGD